MMKRSARVFALLCSVVLSLVIVVAALASEERITPEVVLTSGRDPNVNIVQDYGDVSWTQILTEEFQKEYPYVDVEWRTGSREQLIVMIAAGVGPDIILGNGFEFINMGRQGLFVDLQPLFERDGIDYMRDETFWPPQWSAFNYLGAQFAVPHYLGTIAMYYNVDMFNDVGLPEPDPRTDVNQMDWEDFEQIARRLTRDRDGDGMVDVWGFYKWMNQPDRIHYWIKAAGSDFYGNPERTASTMDNPRAVEAVDFLRSLRWGS